MTCSWQDNFIVNNNYIFIEGEECDHNFPSLKTLKPGESKMYQCTLIKSLQFDYPCEGCDPYREPAATKLGLIIIDDVFKSKNSDFDYDLAMRDKSKWTIIWSNPLFLLTETGIHPK
jgi:hypothetical protein